MSIFVSFGKRFFHNKLININGHWNKNHKCETEYFLDLSNRAKLNYVLFLQLPKNPKIEAIVDFTSVWFQKRTSYYKHFTNSNIITKQLNTKKRQLRSKLNTCTDILNKIISEITAK